MSLRPCDVCKGHIEAKPVSLYWAWNPDPHTRVALRQRLCTACFGQTVVPWQINGEQPVLVCPVCGIGTVDDYDATYVTIVVPGFPKLSCEWATCGSCALTVREFARTGADPLPERQLGAEASAPSPSDTRLTWEEYRRSLQ